MTRSRELVFALVLGVAGIGFGVALLEAGVRLAHLEPDRFWVPDPVLGTRLEPGRTGWWTQEDREFTVPVRINPQGLRDVPRAPEKPAGTFRILVLGDSFTEALQVPLERAYTRLLENYLTTAQGRSPIEVINGGVSGYGTAAELLFFRRVGVGYDPDLVVLAFYPGNDVMNNSPELEQTLVPVYGSDGTLERMAPAHGPRRTARGVRALLARSKAYRYGRRMLLTRQPALAEALVRAGLLRAEALQRHRVEEAIPAAYGVYASSATPAWERAWERTGRLVGELRDEVKRAGAVFAVVIVAGRDEVCRPCWEDVVSTYPAMQAGGFDVDSGWKRAAALCESHGISYLALTPIMRAEEGTDPLHFRHDGHWTAAGHRLAARAIGDFLVARKHIPVSTEAGHGA